MTRRILILQGHPDGSEPHLCHALAQAYAEGAIEAGHTVRRVDLAVLDFPLLTRQRDWEHGLVPAALASVQQDIAWAGHVVLVFPLWLGDMPARVKGFFEQVFRPGFAVHREKGELQGIKLLTGRSARVVVTMGMPALLYRWYFRAQAVSLIERNIFDFVGISPVRRSFVGDVGKLDEAGVARWQARLRRLGAQGR